MNEPIPYERIRPLNILLVEDDARLRSQASEILEEYCNRADAAADGVEALEMYRAYREKTGRCYDIVLSDIQMPRMDGVELTSKLYELCPGQMIIILSGHTETDYLLALINLGVAQFIPKPIRYEEVLQTLVKLSAKIVPAVPPLPPQPSETVDLADGVIWCREKQMLLDGGEPVSLSKYEIILMTLLVSKLEQVCSSDEICHHFDRNGIDIDPSNLRGMVMRLRKKLPADALTSVYGMGYRLSPLLR